MVLGTGDGTHLVHNAGILQYGPCFTLLHGGTPEPPDVVARRRAHDAARALVLAARIGPRRRRHAARVPRRDARAGRHLPHPHRARRDVDGHARPDHARRTRPRARRRTRAPSLYGWSIASDRHVTYLFAHCHRQFGFGFLGHDPCTAEVRVARVPRGDLDAVPRYWDGRGWVGRPGSRRRRRAVRRTGRRGAGSSTRCSSRTPTGVGSPSPRRATGGASTIYLDRAVAPDRAVDDDRARLRPRTARRPRRASTRTSPASWRCTGARSSSGSATTAGTAAPRRTTARRSSPCRWRHGPRGSAVRRLSDRGRRAASGRRPRSSPRRRR